MELRTDILVVGGGLGGVAAALAALRAGRSVVITEECDWVGGQLTAQGVPPDEHPWIEQFGCTSTYRSLRDGIRDYYRRHYPLTAAARARPFLNPGGAPVSRLCHEPRVALGVIESMLAPYRGSGRLRVLLRHRPIAADTSNDRVDGVTVASTEDGRQVHITAAVVIDATETGELLPLTGTEFVVGTESQAQTGEAHAPNEADARNIQAITWCFAIDHLAGEHHTIEKPNGYDAWQQVRTGDWPSGPFTWELINWFTREPMHYRFNPNPEEDPGSVSTMFSDKDKAVDDDLWLYRRIAARKNFVDGAYASDISLINWVQNDYFGAPIYDVPADEATANLNDARTLSLGLLYWMQTAAPRPDGGAGYPGLRLRGDLMGTDDGLAMKPYVRESRRIQAQYTIVEQDLAKADRQARGAKAYRDTVGIGSYRMDFHPSTGGGRCEEIPAYPFQIPLGSLLPVRVQNLLAGAKNLGTTHITNSCYRLHPVEWNIGESAGHLAAFCLARECSPTQVRENSQLLDEFQGRLARDGVELAWPRIDSY